MQAVVGVWVGAGDGFVDENGEIETVGNFDGIKKRLIRVDAAVHLGPVEDVRAIGNDGAGVELTNPGG